MKPRRHLFQSVMLFTLTFLFVQTDWAQQKITILHTNDMHAGFTPHEASWIKETPKPFVGGFNELWWKVDSLRKAKPAIILMDAGDVMTGNPITDYQSVGAYGGALFSMMNTIGYDAWTPGNHDFDISLSNLRALTKIMKAKTVSCNLIDSVGTFPVNNAEYVVIERNGMKIGVIGLMSRNLHHLVSRQSIQGISVLPPVPTIKKVIERVRPTVDLLIALTHQGIDDDVRLAEETQGLDLIVGGHTHTRITTPRTVNGVLIVQAGSNCENLGFVDLDIVNRKIARVDGRLLQLWYNGDRPATRLSLFIDSVQSAIDDDYKVVLVTLSSDWVRGKEGSAIGNFVVDAQREAVGADIAFTNDHGIRKNLSAGPMTRKDLFEILPFRNMIVTFPLTGKELKIIIENFIRQKTPIHFSGVRCEYRNTNGAIEFLRLDVGGKAIEDQKTYLGAASDYFIGEAKRYLGIEVPSTDYTNTSVFDAAQTKAKNIGTMNPLNDSRIKELR